MPERTGKLEVLLVQFWIRAPDAIISALQAAGLDLRVTRVDIEPALNAVLGRERFDLVIFDPEGLAFSLETVEACLRANRCDAPLLAADELAGLGERAAAALHVRRN